MIVVLLAALVTTGPAASPATGVTDAADPSAADVPETVPYEPLDMHPPDDPEAPPQPAQIGAADALYAEGLRLYGASDFTAAIAAFEKAYAAQPRPDIVFAWAQAERLAGDCARAVALFEKFLAGAPPEQHVDAARLAMKRCQAAPVPATTVKPVRDAGIGRQSPDGGLRADVGGKPRPSWYRDPVGGALVGAGLITAAVGAGLIMAAHDRVDNAAGGHALGSFTDAQAAAHRRFDLGVGAIIVGGALTAVGAVRYVWFSVGAGGVAATVGGRF